MTALTGNDVPPANVASFVRNGARMLKWIMETSHVQFISMKEYADYYQHISGARPGGRSIDPLPYDARELGDDFLNMNLPHRQVRVLGMMGYTNIEGAVLLSKASPIGLVRADRQAGGIGISPTFPGASARAGRGGSPWAMR